MALMRQCIPSFSLAEELNIGYSSTLGTASYTPTLTDWSAAELSDATTTTGWYVGFTRQISTPSSCAVFLNTINVSYYVALCSPAGDHMIGLDVSSNCKATSSYLAQYRQALA